MRSSLPQACVGKVTLVFGRRQVSDPRKASNQEPPGLVSLKGSSVSCDWIRGSGTTQYFPLLGTPPRRVKAATTWRWFSLWPMVLVSEVLPGCGMWNRNLGSKTFPKRLRMWVGSRSFQTWNSQEDESMYIRLDGRVPGLLRFLLETRGNCPPPASSVN